MEATFFKDYDQIPVEHRSAVNACVKHGLLEGTVTGEFAPNENITLGQLCEIVCTTVNSGEDLPEPDDSDRDLGSRELYHWTSKYISWCRKKGIYLKHGDFVSPDTLAVYSDISDMFSRAYHYVTKQSKNGYSLGQRHSFGILDEKVTRSGLAYEIDILCQAIGTWCLDNREILDFTSPELQRKVFFFSTFLPSSYSNYSHIFNVAFQIDPYFKFKDIPILAANEILNYKEGFFNKVEENDKIYHFTNLTALKALSAFGAHFRMSNAAFLNDPSEGQLLGSMLSSYLKKSHNEVTCPLLQRRSNTETGAEQKSFRPTNTYIASFSLTDINSMPNLPMWNIYGDHSRGCAIQFNPTHFDCDLYHVFYDSEEKANASKFLKGYIETLNKIWEGVDTKNSQVISFLKAFALDVLTQCSYLFKDRAFEYEEEARAIVFCSPQDAMKEDSPRDGELFPRTYCELPFHIEHVIFGPAVAEPKRLAVGAASMGLDCTFEKSDIPFKNA